MLLDPAKGIKIGTSGYSYSGRPPKGWYGAFYPEKKTGAACNKPDSIMISSASAALKSLQ